MLKNRRSATPTKDRSPGGNNNETTGKRNSFFNRGPSRSSLTSDRFNASGTSNNESASISQNPHWSEHLKETVLVSDLYFELEGGADVGQFPLIGKIDDGVSVNNPSDGVRTGDVLLEVQGQKVSGYTLADVTAWLKHCLKNRNPVVIKTATKGRKKASWTATERVSACLRSRPYPLFLIWQALNPADLNRSRKRPATKSLLSFARDINWIIREIST